MRRMPRYRDSVLPPRGDAPAGGRGGRRRRPGGATSGSAGRVLGIDHFGASGKGPEVLAHFGFTADNVGKQISELLKG